MSDPVTNVEIEDVLSSIRKLVADDARSAPAAPAKPKVDRLVLTPALRVKDAPASPDHASDRTEEPMVLTDPVPNETLHVVQERPIDDIPGDARLADFGDVEGAFPDMDSVEDVAAADRIEAVDPAQTNARLDLGRLIEAEVAAALGGATDDMDDDDESHASVEDPWAPDDAQSDINDGADIAFEHRPLDRHVAAESHDEPGDAVHTPPPQTLEDKVAALSRLVNGGSQDFEEERDTPDADDLTAVSEPMVWPNDTTYETQTAGNSDDTTGDATVTDDGFDADKDTLVVRPKVAWQGHTQAADVVEDEVTNDDPDAAPTEDVALVAPMADAPQAPAIDEDMLREMVSDIVRQELQGVLGERITRNVRKLVRREIHRMLVSQELE